MDMKASETDKPNKKELCQSMREQGTCYNKTDATVMALSCSFV